MGEVGGLDAGADEKARKGEKLNKKDIEARGEARGVETGEQVAQRQVALAGSCREYYDRAEEQQEGRAIFPQSSDL